MRGIGAVAGMAIVALSLAGCGETVIDDVKTEEALEQSLSRSTGQKATQVECPSGVEVETGATFQCEIVAAGGAREVATLKIVNEDADVNVVDLRPAAEAKGE